LPFRAKFEYISYWNISTLFLIKHILGIDYKVKGFSQVPKDKPFVVLSNHQSQLETFLLLLLFKPVSIIIKKELLSIPGFGWGLAMLKPIPIDRSNPKQALKQIQSIGSERIQQDNLPVLIFPEGTRVAPNKQVKYARSGAALAIANNIPVVYVAHNAGHFWPSDKFLKYPGLFQINISPPQDVTGKTAKEITEEAEQWIRGNMPEPQFK
jgi:1-acyl-sn-glycerol-3-phosphate acyltransferase